MAKIESFAKGLPHLVDKNQSNQRSVKEHSSINKKDSPASSVKLSKKETAADPSPISKPSKAAEKAEASPIRKPVKRISIEEIAKKKPEGSSQDEHGDTISDQAELAVAKAEEIKADLRKRAAEQAKSQPKEQKSIINDEHTYGPPPGQITPKVKGPKL